MFQPNKNQILAGVAVLAIVVTGALVYANTSGNPAVSFLKLPFGATPDALAKKSVDYLNKSVLQQGQSAELVSVSEESGVVKMQIKIGTNTYDSYVSKDGKLLFPEAFNLDGSSVNATTQNTQNTANAQIASAVAKVAKTSLDAYVVSSCPYGLQAIRAIAEAVKNIPALADHVKVRYIGSISGNTTIAMHGPEEAENDRIQMCIREEQPSKYWNYVGCYMKNATGKAANGMPFGDTKTCQTVAGIDAGKLNDCMSDPNRVLKYAKEDFDLANKIGVKGSPTFTLNGQVITEDAFGGRSADSIKNMICDSSLTAPEFCSTPLNTTPANTSFSLTYAASAPAGGATAIANPNCAPAAQ